ncbi:MULTISPECIES: PA14 domain-containing protein [Streptomyces]
MLPTAAGAPTAPAWPEGSFDAAPVTAAAGGTTAPAPSGPADGAVLADVRPELAAGRPSGAVSYEFVIGTGDGPRSGQVTSSGWLRSPRWRVPAGLLKDGGAYRWTVRAKDRSGRVSHDAPARSFTVNQRLGAPAPGGPVTGDTLGPVTVGLATGNVSLSVATPQVNTGAGPLGATFSYNSQAAGASAGLTGSYYAGDAESGIGAGEKPAAVRTDARPDFRWDAGQAAYPGAEPGAAFRVRWSGRLRVPAGGTFRLGGTFDGGVRILVDGKPVLDDWRGKGTGGRVSYGRQVVLTAGRDHDLVVEYRRHAGGGQAALWASGAGRSAPVPASWLQPSGAILPPGWTVTPPPAAAAGPASAAPGAGGAPRTNAAAASSLPGGTALAAAAGAAPAVPVPAAGAALAGAGAAPVVPRAQSDDHAAGTRGRTSAARGSAVGGPERQRAGLAATADTGVTFAFGGDRTCADGSGAPAGYVCAVTVPGAGTTRLVYRDGKLSRIINPGDEITDLGFSADHRLTAVRPPLVMDWIAVDRGRRDTDAARYLIDYAAGSATASSVTGPDPQGRPGRTDQRPQHTYRIAAGSAEVTVTGAATPQGWNRKVTHDASGRLLTDTDGTGRTTRFSWTAADQPAFRTDAGGRMTTTVYNEAGLPTGSYGPGPATCFGADLRLLDPAPGGCAKVPAQTTVYGPAGTTTERADSDGVPHQVVETRLGEAGLPTATVVDPGGLALTTGFEFDAAFRPTAKVQPDGTRQTFTAYGPDEKAADPCTRNGDPVPQRGLPRSVALPESATGTARVEKFVYNERGLPAAVNFGGAEWTCVSYDARGRISRMDMPGNSSLPAWTVRYDTAYGGDPLTTRADTRDVAMVNTVDLLGRTVRYTDGLGTRTETSYDRAGRPETERVVPPSSADAAQVKQVRYDAAGRVLAVALNGQRLATAEYDPAGALQRVQYGNSTRLSVDRDEAGRITAKSWTLSDGRTVTDKVTRSRSGAVVAEHAPGDPAGSNGTDFRYDAAGRLVQARTGGREYRLDFTSPASADCPKGTRANAGANGNVITRTERTAKGTTVTGYCYDDADRLLATTGDRPLTGMTYALNGHLTGYTTGDGRKLTQRQDAAERYRGAAVTGDGAAEVTYTQDMADHLLARATRTAQGDSTLYYGHTGMAASPVDLVLGADKRALTRVVDLPGGVIVSVAQKAYRGGRTTWNHPAVRGDIVLVTGGDGRQVGDVYQYGLYGEPLAPDGTTDARRVPDNLPGDFDYGWLGRYRVGTEHQGALYNVVLDTRVFNTSFGRFSAPVSGGPFLNPYEYAAGDPVNHTSINGYSLDVEQE